MQLGKLLVLLSALLSTSSALAQPAVPKPVAPETDVLLYCSALMFFRAYANQDEQQKNAFMLRFDRLGLAAEDALSAAGFSSADIRTTRDAYSREVTRDYYGGTLRLKDADCPAAD